jgi:hypothetical protein
VRPVDLGGLPAVGEFLSEGDLYGYILEIIGFDSSTVVIGMNIDTLAFGNPKPLLAVTLPTITP